MHHFVAEMCTCVHISVTNGVLWDICLMHCGICEMGLLTLSFKIHWRKHSEARDKIAAILQTAFSNAFSCMKIVDSNFTEMCSRWSN